MKIVLTGGGTGGHVYPLIAIAERLNQLADKNNLLEMKLYYLSDAPYDPGALFDNSITFKKISAGKLRMYFSLQNFFDLFKTASGVVQALMTLYSIYPDVVISKGGYASFPTLVAARILRIPVVIHESDAVPGRVNKWAGKFARRIAVSYPETVSFFPSTRTAHTGQPIRSELIKAVPDAAFSYLGLNANIPTILIVGGSQGAEIINNAIVDMIPQLVERYQIIHQAGPKQLEQVQGRADFLLTDNPNKNRYKAFAFLNPLAVKMSAGAASLIISRAGSMIFEIASWGVPSIIIPISNSHGDHQRKNAFNYARSGACLVIEEANLDTALLLNEIDELLASKDRVEKMQQSALAFAGGDAALTIAQEVMDIALEHER